MRRFLALPLVVALGLLVTLLVPIQARGPQAPAVTGATQAPATPDATLLVTASWLAQHLEDPDLVLLHLGDRPGYDAGHIPGARLVALNDVLVDTDTHLLEMPAPDELRRRLAALGVSDQSRVVVYWARDWVSPATRIVFTLDDAGLGARTSLLDGGMPAWVKDGHPLSTAPPLPRTGTLSPLAIRPIVVDAAFVRDHLSTPGYAVVDARAGALYDGSQRGGSDGSRVRLQETAVRRAARGPHRPFLRRLPDQLADHAVPRPLRGGHQRGRHLELDERLRHGRHLPDEGDRVLRPAVGRGGARTDDPAVAAHLGIRGRVRFPQERPQLLCAEPLGLWKTIRTLVPGP
jgi:rhodanese-related sulfurtransferase